MTMKKTILAAAMLTLGAGLSWAGDSGTAGGMPDMLSELKTAFAGAASPAATDLNGDMGFVCLANDGTTGKVVVMARGFSDPLSGKAFVNAWATGVEPFYHPYPPAMPMASLVPSAGAGSLSIVYHPVGSPIDERAEIRKTSMGLLIMRLSGGEQDLSELNSGAYCYNENQLDLNQFYHLKP